MREIKFRAWVEENKKMYDDVTFDKIEVSWFDPETKQDPDDTEPGCWILIGDLEANSLLPQAILMQYTGLKDKNGKEIYEGDIVTTCFDSEKQQVGVVAYRVPPLFGTYEDKRVQDTWLPGEALPILCYKEELREVIGNVYENPDLVK